MNSTILCDQAQALFCPQCSSHLNQEATACASCGLAYHLEENYLEYDADTLLQKNFKKQWLLNKVLNNNGYLSYLSLKEGSLSLPEREDVQTFGRFIEKYVKEGTVLDIGCGILPLPGYLQYLPRHCNIIGLDPIENKEFKGFFIKGCAEYLPLPPSSVNSVVFGTSLDHVVDLDKTITETKRVLSENGKVLIWMGDRTEYLKQINQENSLRHKYELKDWEGLKALFLKKWQSLCARIKGEFDEHQCWVYQNGTALYIPHGAVDPFHSFHETAEFISNKFFSQGFKQVELSFLNPNLVLLCFER